MSNFRSIFRHSALALGLLGAAQAMAADLTVISFGGANKEAQTKAFYQPWEAAGKGKVIAGEYNGEMAKVKAMVDTNSVSWHLVEVESPELTRGCDEGLFEELDPALFGNPDDFIEGAIQPCGVGFFVWSTVLAYNADKQAFIKNPRGGTFRDLVVAAESCTAKIIHPGTPWNPAESDLESLRERARAFA